MRRTVTTTNGDALSSHIENNPFKRAKQPCPLRFRRPTTDQNDHLETKEPCKQLLHRILGIILITTTHGGLTDQSGVMMFVQSLAGYADLMPLSVMFCMFAYHLI